MRWRDATWFFAGVTIPLAALVGATLWDALRWKR